MKEQGTDRESIMGAIMVLMIGLVMGIAGFFMMVFALSMVYEIFF